MKSKEEHIQYWLTQAEDDWEVVNTLFEGKKYLQSLFFAHLVIEKICKALWIKHNDTNVPPKTHNLNLLLSQTPLTLSDEQNEFLLNLNRFQLEGRYPEHITKMKQICNYDFTNEIIAKTKEIKLWLQEKLQ
ncbi:MAG: HEPN domain-containing protein [Ignavibacteriales bacterium]|nr:HEPN domain-containing protein [Ignavibacteriales bacterium]